MLIVSVARSYTVEAKKTLLVLMRYSKDERVRVTALQALLDRGCGKAKVEVVSSGESGYLELLRAVNERALTIKSLPPLIILMGGSRSEITVLVLVILGLSYNAAIDAKTQSV